MRLLTLLLALLIVACEPQQREEYYQFKPSGGTYVKPTPTPEIAPKRTLSLQEQRWNEAQIRKEKLHYVKSIAAQIQRYRSKYEVVSSKTKVPWDVIGGLHYRESDLDFRTNLANGDPLTAKTRHVPKGLPVNCGSAPFSWDCAAIEALRFDRLDKESWSTITDRLNNVEAFNGLGYYRYGIPSPYLYSMTSIYKSGKFIADGHFSPTAIDQQVGVAAIFKSDAH